MVLSCWARASLRYRIARTLLMKHLKSNAKPALVAVKIAWLPDCSLKSRAHQLPSQRGQRLSRPLFARADPGPASRPGAANGRARASGPLRAGESDSCRFRRHGAELRSRALAQSATMKGISDSHVMAPIHPDCQRGAGWRTVHLSLRAATKYGKYGPDNER